MPIWEHDLPVSAAASLAGAAVLLHLVMLPTLETAGRIGETTCLAGAGYDLTQHHPSGG